MKTASGLEVKLRAGGGSLQEYERASDNDEPDLYPTLRSYVEAVSDSTFAVQVAMPPWAARSPDEAMLVDVFLDGKGVTGCVCPASRFASKPYILLIEGIDQMTPRGRELQRFAFAQLKVDEESNATDTKPEHLKHLGTITIECIWCTQGQEYTSVVTDLFKPAVATSIHEKCLKGRAISNQASTAKPENIAGVAKTVEVAFPYGRTPFAIFEYKYRSRRELQIEGVIDKDPEPLALEDRDPSSLTAAEIGQLQRQLQTKREDMAKIKNEKRAWVHADGSKDGEGVEVVSGGHASKKRKPSDSEAELIDLTDA